MNTTRTDSGDYRHPAYPWLMCGSLGLAACALYYLLGYRVGWRWDWADAAALWVGITFGLPGLGGLALALSGAGDAFLRYWLSTDDDRREDVTDEPEPPEPVTRTPLVGGYLLNELEAHCYEGLLRLFQHAAAAGSLTSGALIGPAFNSWEHWGYWTNLAARSGFCVKANGVTTELPEGRTYAWVVGQIRLGNILWPSADDPAPQPLPHPFRAGLEYKGKVEKVGKAGEKVAKVDFDD